MINDDYIEIVEGIGFKILEPFKGMAQKHNIKCVNCGVIDNLPLSPKLRTFNTTGYNGCPNCAGIRKAARYRAGQTAIIDSLCEMGIEILDPNFHGQYLSKEKIHIKNTRCGHDYYIPSVSLVRFRVVCTVCGQDNRLDN